MRIEVTLKNAITWSKREWLKYGWGNYSLRSLVEVAEWKYNLREEEVEYLKKSLIKWLEKNYLRIDMPQRYYLENFKITEETI